MSSEYCEGKSDTSTSDKVHGLGLICCLVQKKAPLGLEDFLTYTEALDEVTCLAQDLCCLLSKCFFRLKLPRVQIELKPLHELWW